MKSDVYQAYFMGVEVEIEYDDSGVFYLQSDDWDLFVGQEEEMRAAFYGSQRLDVIRNVLALAEWCEEGLQWNA